MRVSAFLSLGVPSFAASVYSPGPRRTLVATLSLLLGGSSAVRGQCPTELFSFDGSAPGDIFGYSIAGAGDVNGDGFDDIIAAAPSADFLTLNGTGRVTILSGANGGILFLLVGAASGDQIGSSVAGVGDVDGDGFDDLLVGARYSSPAGLFHAGRAVLMSGSSAGMLFTFTGASAGDELGFAVAGAGDVNGDTLPDVIVGAPRADYAGQDSGRALVFSAANGTVLHTFDGASSGDQFGHSVAGAGDLNGDGFGDVLVGAPMASPGGVSQAGRAVAISGLTGTILLTFTGTSAIDWLGHSVASAGDVDGDTVPDILIGIPYADPAGPDSGRATVFAGSNGAVLFTFPGTLQGGSLGWSVANAGDVNGDGVTDLLLGAPYGFAAPGYASLISGADGALLSTFVGTAPGDVFGFSVAGAGDVNGDGKADVLIGAPGANPGGSSDAGQAKVFALSGPPSSITPFGTGCPGSGGFVPVASTAGGAPCLGVGFAATLSDALGGTIAILALGISSTTLAGNPLPLNLGPVGMPGCSLYVSTELQFATTTAGSGPGGGVASVPLPIPSDPALAGAMAYLQWYVVDPGPSLVPGAMSQALEVLIL